MVEIEKPRIRCEEIPGDSSYGKYVVEPLELATAPPWATLCAESCCPLCPAPR